MYTGQMESDPITTTYQVAATLAAVTADNYMLTSELPHWLGRRRSTSLAENSLNHIELPNTVLDGYDWHGEGEWVFVYNNEGVDWVAGEIISRSAGSALLASWGYYGTSAGTSSRRDQILGVAQHIIPAGYGGWVKRKGMAEVIVDGVGWTLGEALVESSATAGRGQGVSDAVGDLDGREEQIIGTILQTVAAYDAVGPPIVIGGTVLLNLP